LTYANSYVKQLPIGRADFGCSDGVEAAGVVVCPAVAERVTRARSAFGWIVADNPRSAQRETDGRRIVATPDFQHALALTSRRSSNCPVCFIRLKPCGQILVAFFSVSRNVPPSQRFARDHLRRAPLLVKAHQPSVFRLARRMCSCSAGVGERNAVANVDTTPWSPERWLGGDRTSRRGRKRACP
jgi:hypothetical protein